LLICAGGTGGGVYPAISVLESLELKHQSILWVGSRGGMEEELVTKRNIPYKSIPAAGIHGVGLKRLPGNMWQLLKGVFASLGILRKFNPDVLFFTGGYVAVPMAVAAIRRPSLLYVPDIEPGLAIKAIARFAKRIAVTTESSRMHFSQTQNITITGYPVRPGLKNWTREEGLAYFNFDLDLPTLAVAGGSKGARSINTALLKILPSLLEKMQVIHLCGHLDWESVERQSQALTHQQAQRYQVFPYLHEIGAMMAAADLIVSRGGASTLGEYPLFGLPAILVPYPYAWRYQKVNANYLANCGAAVILADEDLDQQLLPLINEILFNQGKLTEMSQAMASLAVPDAAEKIADMLKSVSGMLDGGSAA